MELVRFAPTKTNHILIRRFIIYIFFLMLMFCYVQIYIFILHFDFVVTNFSSQPEDPLVWSTDIVVTVDFLQFSRVQTLIYCIGQTTVCTKNEDDTGLDSNRHTTKFVNSEWDAYKSVSTRIHTSYLINRTRGAILYAYKKFLYVWYLQYEDRSYWNIIQILSFIF